MLWFAVDDSYGAPVAYQRFVDACHARGLADESHSSWGASVNLDEPEVRAYIGDNVTMWLRDHPRRCPPTRRGLGIHAQ